MGHIMSSSSMHDEYEDHKKTQEESMGATSVQP